MPSAGLCSDFMCCQCCSQLAEALPMEGSGITLPLNLANIASRCKGSFYAPRRFAVCFTFSNSHTNPPCIRHLTNVVSLLPAPHRLSSWRTPTPGAECWCFVSSQSQTPSLSRTRMYRQWCFRVHTVLLIGPPLEPGLPSFTCSEVKVVGKWILIRGLPFDVFELR